METYVDIDCGRESSYECLYFSAKELPVYVISVDMVGHRDVFSGVNGLLSSSNESEGKSEEISSREVLSAGIFCLSGCGDVVKAK